MALEIRKIDTNAAFAAVAAVNSLRRAITATTTYPHCDTTSTGGGDYMAPTATPLAVTAANASSLATLRTLCRDIWRVGSQHFADGVAHVAADTANDWGDQPAEDAALVDLETFLNDVAKANLNAHADETGVHFTDDAALVISTTDASDQGTSNTLANAIKAALNTHILAALAGDSIHLIPG